MNAPRAALLSNGRYRVLLTNAGAGASAWETVALTRWAGDRTRDADGFALLIQDRARDLAWSAGLHPLGGAPDDYRVRSAPGRAQIVRVDHEIETRLDCTVLPDGDGELRLLTLINRGRTARQLVITSYTEVALNHPAADAAHPAFSKLFVQTEYVPGADVLVARRRPRSPDEQPLYLGHVLWVEHQAPQRDSEFETDRMRFIGRGRTLANPAALLGGHMLSRTQGSVLDPVLAIRRTVQVEPGRAVCLVAGLAAGHDRGTVIETLARPTPQRLREVFDLAAKRDRTLRATHGLPAALNEETPAPTGALFYGAGHAVAQTSLPEPSALAPADLHRLGLTGSLPLVVAHVRSPRQVAAAQQIVNLVQYWRAQGVGVDILVLEDGRQANGVRIPAEIAPGLGRTVVREREGVAQPLLVLAERVARFIVGGDEARARSDSPAPGSALRFTPSVASTPPTPSNPEPLQFWNGWGGFSSSGDEYVIRLARAQHGLALPPLPWTNCVANETTGFLVSETGAGYSWSANSRENKLTAWSNDPVSDPHSEALYLRDEDAGAFWSPLPGPVPGAGDYEVRHGFGATTFRHSSLDLDQDVVMFVPRLDPVKLVRLRVTNRSNRARRLSFFSYTQWVLGPHRGDSVRLVATARGPAGAILAMNPHRGEFATRVAFASIVAPSSSASPIERTADRTAFLGERGTVAAPAAVAQATALDERVGVGLDPCAAFRVPFTLAPGETVEFLTLLGEAESLDAAGTLIRRYGNAATVTGALDDVRARWRDLAGRVQVRTPSPAIDLMVNGWLVYQNLSCRMWARSAFYQSGGAFGFRDQLQDAAALIHVDPGITRRQILLHAAHQFREGDALHWWHPPLSKGIRTRFADDLLWLPYVTAGYVRHTGDRSVLDEDVRFLAARPLDPDEDEAFVVPKESGESGDVYEHCCRALDRSLTRGGHGLPLIGTGDWNDGMNRVGREGRGESVWLGFFLYHVLEQFVPLCEARGDTPRAERYAAYRAQMRRALNDAGWDGAWYRRAFYDNGVPLGSAANDECQIDAIAQAWAVLSKAAPAERAARALDAMEARLVDERAGLIRLLHPPFDHTPFDPGYIKGYVPGVRENGGQYTHGALWAIRALAEAGRSERAAHLLEMISPVTRGATTQTAKTYQVEPYVIAADVYGVEPHLGRGGWTWYTGSAGWMFRVALESVLGATVVDGNTLMLRPCIPAGWPGFSLRYALPGSPTAYEVVVEQMVAGRPANTEAHLDGEPLEVIDGALPIPLRDDGRSHQVRVTLGQDVGPRYEESTLPLERITSA